MPKSMITEKSKLFLAWELVNLHEKNLGGNTYIYLAFKISSLGPDNDNQGQIWPTSHAFDTFWKAIRNKSLLAH